MGVRTGGVQGQAGWREKETAQYLPLFTCLGQILTNPGHTTTSESDLYCLKLCESALVWILNISQGFMCKSLGHKLVVLLGALGGPAQELHPGSPSIIGGSVNDCRKTQEWFSFELVFLGPRTPHWVTNPEGEERGGTETLVH